MSLYLVRHAKAGERRAWSGRDELRPLSKRGQRQADALADALADRGITRVVSSEFVRCRQTVEPLARRLGIPVETSDALVEGSHLHEALQIVEKVSGETAVLCSHGDVIGDLLRHYANQGVPLDGDRLEKGSTWHIDVADGDAPSARYLPPPEI